MGFIEDTKEAFGRLFENLESLIGISLIFTAAIVTIFGGVFLLLIQPIISIALITIGFVISLYVGGYGIENMHNIIKGKPLPKAVQKVGKRFIWGIISILIALVYAIPVAIISLGVNLAFGELASKIVSNVLGIIIIFPAAASIIEYSKKMQLKGVISLEVLKKAYRAKFIGYIIGGTIIGYLIMAGLYITVIGGIILGALGTLYIQHMEVKGYIEEKKIKRKRRKKRK